MAGTKRTDVLSILESANYFLANSAPEKSGERRGVIGLLTVVLHDSGNYAGFMYLDGYPCVDESRVKFLRSATLHAEWESRDGTNPRQVVIFE